MSEGKSEKPQPKIKSGLGFDARQRIGREIEQALNSGLPNSSGQHYLDGLDRFDNSINSLKKAAQEAEIRAKKAEEKSFTDALTGCYSKDAWIDFQKHFDPLRGDKTTVILIDLNGFKAINDTRGHQAGDNHLESVGAYFKEAFSRKGDRVFRIGGDEFAIACDFIQPDEREKFNSYVDSYFNHDIIDPKDLDFSYGIAFSEPEEPIEETIDRADRKMFESKNKWKRQHPERYPERPATTP